MEDDPILSSLFGASSSTAEVAEEAQRSSVGCSGRLVPSASALRVERLRPPGDGLAPATQKLAYDVARFGGSA